MATMGSRNPEVPRLNDLGSLAKIYTDFISKPEFENTRNIVVVNRGAGFVHGLQAKQIWA